MSGFGDITTGNSIYSTNLSASATIQAGGLITANALSASTNVTIGGGTPVTKMKIYSVSFSGWSSITAGSTSQQTGTLNAGSFTGLSTSDVLFVNGINPSNWASTNCTLLSISASANQAWFTWRNLAVTSQSPPIGAYKIFAITT